ncbi:MAG TPA: heme lyase CcmF/NrfE family subunit [Longimicrobiales bacterium]|nr:heme lyase CcmF/NrfE family subunit [Longimicrobiales bacterium]
MTRIIGLAAVYAALAIATYGMVAAVAGVRRREAALVRSARAAAYTNFVLLTIANLAMIYGLITHDFSIGYVAQVGSRSTPLFFTVISLWSALEGSILFWGWVLAFYTALAVWLTRSKLGALGAYANATMLGVGAFFYILLIGPANPFHLMSPTPFDGPGPNPLLQNHWLMGVHPPLLYLGYVGMTVPFAFGMGALLSGRLDDTWLRVTRGWTIVAWMFLSLAIVAGMWWSYEVLGWGGWWAWDPVENASFMPWLTATAFLHSAMVQERRGLFRVWNMSLIVSTFVLTILGTFLTRSGILSSVHAFSEGPIGLYFLAFIAVVLLFSMALLAGRSNELRGSGRLDNMASRETVFMVNNLLFAAFTFTVLLGTMFPLVAEAARGIKVSVGAPFFNRMTLPICVALLFLIGVGPMLPWRVANLEELKRKLMVPAGMLLLTLVVCLALGLRNPWGLIAFAFAAFSLTGNVQEFVYGATARRRATGGTFAGALLGLINANPRRYGGYIAHIGLITSAIGMTGSSVLQQDIEATLRPGQAVELREYTVRFDSLDGRDEPHRFVVGANLTVLIDGRETGTLFPRLNYYRARGDEPITTPAVRSRPDKDLYVNLTAFARDGTTVTLHVIVEPLVVWIWIGSFIVAFGALVSMWPRRRRPAFAGVSREQPFAAAEAA